MGRLTLNMLLSFAKFEREVTAERIRDKIAASKARGHVDGRRTAAGLCARWSHAHDVDEHAQLIRDLFRRYLSVGNVRLLKEQLDEDGIGVPERITLSGRSMGGVPFTRGQIYKILANPIYLGEIHHKEKVHDGLHDAIVEREVWDEVQAKLASNAQGTQRAATVRSPSLPAGKVFGVAGEPLVATHACKGRVRYRYYVSRSLQHQANARGRGMRIPAKDLEGAVIARSAEALDDPLALTSELELDIDTSTFSLMLSSATSLAAKVRKKDRRAIRDLVERVEVYSGELRIALCG